MARRKKPESKVRAKEEGFRVRKSYLVVAGIVLAAVILGVVFLGGDKTASAEVVAVVNGETITLDELNKVHVQYQGMITKEKLLENLIQLKVFYQDATAKEIVVSDEEVMAEFEIAKIRSGMTSEQFEENLQNLGITEEELIEQYKKELVMRKYLEREFLDKIEISEDAINEYYNSNPEMFEMKESVVVRHILIEGEESRASAEEVLSGLTEENFCEKVKELTADVASASTCGEYAFTRDDALVDEFKELSFEQKVGEMGIADTVFGSHIIWTVDKLPARTVSFEEAREEIESHLRNEKGIEGYGAFYEELAAKQQIEIFSEKIN